MLSRQASHALKALLELAARPLEWQSTHALATAQQLPEPMLEQLLLRLRRAGLLRARRGRSGGYQLASLARQISVAAVLTAAEQHAGLKHQLSTEAMPHASASDQVTAVLEQRLERARLRTLKELSLEDLLFDLRSAKAGSGSEAGLLLG